MHISHFVVKTILLCNLLYKHNAFQVHSSVIYWYKHKLVRTHVVYKTLTSTPVNNLKTTFGNIILFDQISASHSFIRFQ